MLSEVEDEFGDEDSFVGLNEVSFLMISGDAGDWSTSGDSIVGLMSISLADEESLSVTTFEKASTRGSGDAWRTASGDWFSSEVS